MDGDSLLPYLSGEQPDWKDEVFCEHLAHGTEGPRAMIRQGDWKLNYTHLDEPEFELVRPGPRPGRVQLTLQGSRRPWRFKIACSLESRIFGQTQTHLHKTSWRARKSGICSGN